MFFTITVAQNTSYFSGNDELSQQGCILKEPQRHINIYTKKRFYG